MAMLPLLTWQRVGLCGRVGRLSVPLVRFCHHQLDKNEDVMRKQIDNWKSTHGLFHSTERDTKQFPHYKLADFPPPVRFGFVPETWFRAFYNKTGVTGPYLFGAGLVTFLMSKEILVFNETMAHGLVFAGIMWFVSRKWGHHIAGMMDSQSKQWFDDFYYKPIRDGRDEVKNNISEVEAMVQQLDSKKYISEAKKENLALQLETQYRQRLQKVHDEVKRLLDYQIERQKVQQQFEREHMVSWVVGQVEKGVTPQLEKAYMDSCIAKLQQLSKTV